MRRLIDSLYNLNSFPIFQIHPENIFVIKTPNEFYNALKELSTTSKKRISISSLYIGTDNLGKELVNKFHQAKCNNPELDINILLDYNRGTRETPTKIQNDQKSSFLNESSSSILLPLVNHGAKVNFYLTHKLGGWHRYYWRTKQKWNELCSLHHMKLYIFDDDIIISGANLSDHYFTNRQDRYVLIRDSPKLCDYFDQLIKTISRFSLSLETDGKFKLHENWRYDPRKYFHRFMFKSLANKEIRKLNYEFKKNSDEITTTNDTYVFPLLNMYTIGIKDEEEFTSKLLDNPWPNSKIDIATGYFNMNRKYRAKLIQVPNDKRITILMASEKANGFYKGRGILQYIPLVYTSYVRQFLQQIQQKSNIIVRYFDRPNWSFHGKGIWLKNSIFTLTMVGSTNFGYRSVLRDNEAQILILTKNEQLREKLQTEYNEMEEHSRIIQNDHLPKVPLWIEMFSRVFRSYF